MRRSASTGGNLLDPGLLADRPPYDVIFCRNLLIYLDDRARRRRRLTTLDRLLARRACSSSVTPSASAGVEPPLRAGGRAATASRSAGAATGRAVAAARRPRLPLPRTSPRPSPRRGRSPRCPLPDCARGESHRQPPAPAAISPHPLDDARRGLADRGRHDEAAELCERVIRQSGPCAPAYLPARGDPPGGGRSGPRPRRCFQKAIYLDPGHDEALLALALLAQRRGDSAAAADYRRRAERACQEEGDRDETASTSRLPRVGDCWNRIGDLGRPELPRAGGAHPLPELPGLRRRRRERFFDRPAPTATSPSGPTLLAAPVEPADERGPRASLIFRLGDEWLALRTAGRRRGHRPSARPPDPAPDRTTILVGLVNLRGQLQLCVSLHGLLGVDSAGRRRGPAGEPPRLVVIREAAETWVFAADEVLGVQRFARGRLADRPLDPGQPGRQLQPGRLRLAGPERRRSSTRHGSSTSLRRHWANERRPQRLLADGPVPARRPRARRRRSPTGLLALEGGDRDDPGHDRAADAGRPLAQGGRADRRARRRRPGRARAGRRLRRRPERASARSGPGTSTSCSARSTCSARSPARRGRAPDAGRPRHEPAVDGDGRPSTPDGPRPRSHAGAVADRRRATVAEARARCAAPEPPAAARGPERRSRAAAPTAAAPTGRAGRTGWCG